MSRRIIEQDSPTVSPRPYAKRAAPPELEIKALTKFEREKLKDSKRELQGLPPEKRPVRSPAKTKESKRRVLPSETLSKLKMEAKALAEAEAKANPIPKAPAQEILEPAKQAPKVLWQPNSQVQIDFLSAWEDEVLFSGGRGSGKSDCLLIDPLRWVDNRNFRGLIIRRTMPELRELIDRSKRFYLDFAPGCKWKDQDKLFVFPSGAKIEFGYCETSEDVERYRGQQYTWLGIDEITQFSDDTMLDKLKASLRTSDPNLPIYIRATTNPSGAGCRWVKQRWVDEGPANSTIRKHYTIRGYNGVPDENYVITRRWFNSVPDDNKALSKAYKASLVAIDNDILRRQWLYGEWISEGLAFDEFKVANHVVVPFKLPHNWYKFRACDWGYSSMAVCLWFAVDYDGNIFVYRELKTKGVTADKFAEMVLELEQADNVHYGILDASVWSQRGQVGDTPADTMISMGCYWTPSDSSKGSRVAGKNLIHQYLALDPETNEPRVKIFNTCHELIKEMTSLPLDAHNPEDVDTKACDHAYDAFRYGLSSRPRITSQYYDEFSQGVPIGRNTEVVVDDFFGY